MPIYIDIAKFLAFILNCTLTIAGVLRAHRDPMEWQGCPGMLRALQWVPAYWLCPIVSHLQLTTSPHPCALSFPSPMYFSEVCKE